MVSAPDGTVSGFAAALSLGNRELVAFVGAGGKKTAMHTLCRVGTTQGKTVGYTTTTQMPPPEFPFVQLPPSGLHERVLSALETHGSPLGFAAREIPNPQRVRRKFKGYERETVSALFADGPFDWVLVKADGARQCEFKSPASHEPVLPSRATLVVPVASVKALGEPVGSDRINRSEEVAKLTGLTLDDPLTPETVATVLSSESGSLKGVPSNARVILLCNKADTPRERELAREILAHVWERTDRIECGLVTSFERDNCERVVPPN